MYNNLVPEIKIRLLLEFFKYFSYIDEIKGTGRKKFLHYVKFEESV